MCREEFDVSPKPEETRRFAEAGEVHERWPQPWQYLSDGMAGIEEERPQPWQVFSVSGRGRRETGGRV